MQFPFPVFFVLVGAGVFGAIAVMPYAFSLNRDRLADVPMSRQRLVILSVVQAAVLTAVAVGLGLLMGREIGLGAPIIEGLLAGEALPAELGSWVLLAIALGAVSSILVAGIEQFVFKPHLPPAFQQVQGRLAVWKRFLAGFYGGITEEILMRLFLMTLITWLVGKVWMTPDGLPADGAYWVGIFGAAILFGIGHLPATRAIAPLTSMLIIRALVLNGIVGIAAGYLYWQYGLLLAMIAHFTADMVLHVLTPLVVRSEETPKLPSDANALLTDFSS